MAMAPGRNREIAYNGQRGVLATKSEHNIRIKPEWKAVMAK